MRLVPQARDETAHCRNIHTDLGHCCSEGMMALRRMLAALMLAAATAAAGVSATAATAAKAPVTAATAAAPAAISAYRLGIQDQLRIKVFDWRQTVGEVHEWSSVGGDYTVGPDGAVSLPLLGEVGAAGLTTAQLAHAISARLQARVGLAQPPDTSIEIMRYRPFYILGAVNKPGEYPYRPNLTVLEAVSIAGGLFRPGEEAYSQLLGTAISTTGNLHAARNEIDVLTARRARLQAELANAGTISFPAELTQRRNDPEVAHLLQQETAAFDTWRDDTQAQLTAVSQYKLLLSRELGSLHTKAGDEDRELALIGGELRKIGSLVGRGLAIAPREFQLRQNQIELQGRRVDLDTAQLRAREEIGRADQRLLDLQAQWHNQILQDLQTTQSRLAQAEINARTDTALLAATPIDGAGFTADPNGDRATVTYTLVRGAGGAMHATVVSEDAPVDPGDVIKVRRSFDQSGAAHSAAAGSAVSGPAVSGSAVSGSAGGGSHDGSAATTSRDNQSARLGRGGQ
jgi:protein involved in polysaccharide export with SLBB domain